MHKKKKKGSVFLVVWSSAVLKKGNKSNSVSFKKKVKIFNPLEKKMLIP